MRNGKRERGNGDIRDIDLTVTWQMRCWWKANVSSHCLPGKVEARPVHSSTFQCTASCKPHLLIKTKVIYTYYKSSGISLVIHMTRGYTIGVQVLSQLPSTTISAASGVLSQTNDTNFYQRACYDCVACSSMYVGFVFIVIFACKKWWVWSKPFHISPFPISRFHFSFPISLFLIPSFTGTHGLSLSI